MYIENVRKIIPDVVKWRRYLHQFPEIGFELDKTVSFIETVLLSLNINCFRVAGGIVADINTINEGKTNIPKRLALRCDIDGLPITEESGLPFASKNGNMHACGHDAHAACLLGVAKLLSENKKDLKCNVRLIFQPAEELGLGSVKMIDAGVLDNVDEIIGVHLGSLDYNADIGTISIGLGSVLSCMDKFIIKVRGCGSHGSMPEKSIDPIFIASQIIVSLQSIISRELSPFDQAVVSVCQFKAGDAFNIIPETAHLEGTIRAFTNEMRYYLRERIETIARSTALAHRADIEYEFILQPPPLVNNINVAKKVLQTVQDLYPENVKILEHPLMAGEDFSNYLEIVPGAFFFVNNPLPVDGVIYPHHHPKFALDETQFEKSISIMFKYAMDNYAI